MPDHFLLEKDGSIATLTFNRPEKRNPLNEDISLELERLQYQIRDDKDIRVVVFTGTGNTFSAGADLSPIRGISDRQERRKIFAPLGKRWTRAIARTLDHVCQHGACGDCRNQRLRDWRRLVTGAGV